MNSLPSHEAKLARLRADAADRVRERATLIFYGAGTPMTWPEADELAYRQEAFAQRPLPGCDK